MRFHRTKAMVVWHKRLHVWYILYVPVPASVYKFVDRLNQLNGKHV